MTARRLDSSNVCHSGGGPPTLTDERARHAPGLHALIEAVEESSDPSPWLAIQFVWLMACEKPDSFTSNNKTSSSRTPCCPTQAFFSGTTTVVFTQYAQPIV